MPDGLRDLGAFALRYQGQLLAYVLLQTARYPHASPRAEFTAAGPAPTTSPRPDTTS